MEYISTIFSFYGRFSIAESQNVYFSTRIISTSYFSDGNSIAGCYVSRMNFENLHELLRLELLRRIENGNLTGAQVARQVGFQQAHISNFLNRRRSLSLEGLDRVLAALSLTVENILPLQLDAVAAHSDLVVEAVPVVSHSVLLDQKMVPASAVIETLHLPASHLYAQQPRTVPQRADWQRFIAVRIDVDQAAPMEPVLTPGCIAVVDRHYNSLAPYRAQQPSVYAVRSGHLLFRYVSFEEDRLILRPYQLRYPVLLQPVAPADSPSSHILGRVCMVINDL
jgi:transcriptional regulator with XRE-family HTH domain